MEGKLKILIVEDVEVEADLLVTQLRRTGLKFEFSLVDTKDDFTRALTDYAPDIVLSDYNLPQFNGMMALIITRDISPLVPFILVTGSVNEEIAVECMKAGADDYILKQNLSRLDSAIKSALRKSEILKAKEEVEKALLRSEAIFTAFMEHSPYFVFFKDNEVRPVRLSRNFEKMLGMPVEDAIGKTMDELFPSELSKQMISDDLKVLNEKVPVRIIEELNGRIYETIKFPIESPDNLPMLAGFTSDITDQKVLEKQLIQSNNKISSIINNLNGVVYRCRNDHEWSMEYLSEGITELTGFDLSDFIDNSVRSFNSLIHVKDQSFVWGEIQSAISGKKAYQIEYRIVTRDGEIKWVWERGRGVFDESGLVALEGYVSDITPRKKIEEALIQAKEKAEESDRLKSAFLHNISHEIRTPMNAIVGFSAMLEDPATSPENARNFSQIMCQSSDQLLSIITHIVNIATIDAGQEKLNIKEVNLNKIVDLIYEQFRLRAEKMNLSLSLNKGLENNNAITKIDETKLEQILSNLLNNAFKFTENGRIDFGYILKGDFIEFFVKDTGIGISKKDHDRIFERFFQVDNTFTRTGGGTGLGLSLSKAYVGLLGGKIWMESTEEKGSAFYFTVPYDRVESAPVINQKVDSESILPLQKKKTILIAEDEENNFLLLKYILNQSNIEIVRAIDGIEAVDYVKTGKHFDLIIMDIKMPRMGGIEATRIIKEFNSKIPVLALTAYAQDSDKIRIMSSGFDDYLSKPIKKELLLSVVNKYLLKKEIAF